MLIHQKRMQILRVFMNIGTDVHGKIYNFYRIGINMVNLYIQKV